MLKRACACAALVIALAPVACGDEASSGNPNGGPSQDASTHPPGPDGTTSSGDGGAAGAGGSTSGSGGSQSSGGASGDIDASSTGGSTPADDGGDAGTVVPGGPDIEVGATELVFSAFRGMKSAQRALVVKNVGGAALDVSSLKLAGPSGNVFELLTPPGTPLQIAAGADVTLHLDFAPGAQAMLGVNQGALQIASNDPDEAMVEVALWGLATKAAQGENEPPLQQVVDTLGYAIDVGGTTLSLGTGAAPIGDEVPAQRFKRASAGPVTMKPVARYSPDEPIPYGYYTSNTGQPVIQVGIIQMGQEQTLLPEVDPASKPDFDPGDVAFGLYATSKGRLIFSEDALNKTGVKHASRAYPLKDRAGKPVANTYLVGFEEAANGDYNDDVFVIGNVTPAP
jgi:hypothetical protein